MSDATSRIAALVRPVADLIAPLSSADRIDLLTTVLCQEVCMLPHGERRRTLWDVMQSLPRTLDATEAAMRMVLTAKAKGAGA